ncbi:hypothetical protein FG386_002552 [Cryptosporidium ryanae]|uniref:uncharacterized protein n=1 Tax=Cryptosporidium ryanae TaxID=515981 RepID=UPI003519EDEE|nr:hypothetical protein FG386_002552 [Cryptosporidium ryanae]
MSCNNIYYLINNDLNDLFDCYFCESCDKIVVQDCVRFEADTYFCPRCLENIPTSEAFSNNFCCKKCYYCFQCNATVCTSSTTNDKKLPDNEGIEFKRFSCEYCGYVYVFNDSAGSEGDINEIESYNPEGETSKTNDKTDFSVEIFNYIRTIIESLNGIVFIDPNHNKNKHLPSKDLILEKDVWLNKNNIRLLCDNKKVIDKSTKKDPKITLTQYLDNPKIINSHYIYSKHKFNAYSMKLPLVEMKLCAQFSKRCFTCKRLVIKPQLNPVAQPPFRINLSANLFIPNFKLLSIENNVLYKGNSYHAMLKLRVENLMDRITRIDFITVKENAGNNSIDLDKFEDILIEPRNITIEPKWTPTTEQIQNQQTQDSLREKRGRNKQKINVYIRSHDSVKTDKLKISGVSNFKSPTGNDSTIMFTVFMNNL